MCPEFAHVPAPVFTPTRCIACWAHAHKDGFIDLVVDDPIAGRAYLCASCVYTAGQKLKMLSPAQADNLTERLRAGQEAISTLQGQLDVERENKYVSLADVKELVGGTA